MRIALAALCIGAVTFSLRVLVALVREWMQAPPHTAKFYFARFSPLKQRGELIVMNPEPQRRGFATRDGERMAL